MNTSSSRLPRPALILVVTRGVSSIGSTLTSFGLNVWLFRVTGSYDTFAFLAALATLPSLLFAPFAGMIADRWNKRVLLLACELASLAAVGGCLLLDRWHRLDTAAVAVTMLVLAVASELRWSVLGASITLLVPKHQLGRMNGLQQAFRGLTVMLGPMLGALGLDAFGLDSLLGMDVSTYLIAIGGLLLIKIGAPPTAAGKDRVAFDSFWQELSYGFRWTFARPGLRRLLLFFMAINVGVCVFSVTFAPYILSFASNQTYGVGLGLQGAGAFVTGFLLARSRRERDHEAGILWGALGFGICMFAWGIAKAALGVWAVALLLGTLSAIIMTSSQTLWQSHVPAAIQGKVFAVRTMLSFGLTPLAIIASIPLASLVFAPLLRIAPLAAVWGSAGTGAGLGFMVSMFGIAIAACAAWVIRAGGLGLADTGVPAIAPLAGESK